MKILEIQSDERVAALKAEADARIAMMKAESDARIAAYKAELAAQAKVGEPVRMDSGVPTTDPGLAAPD